MNREVNTIGSKADGAGVPELIVGSRPNSRRCASRCRMSSSAAPRAAVRRVGAVGHRQDDAWSSGSSQVTPGLRRVAVVHAAAAPAPGEADGVDYNFVIAGPVRGDDRRRRSSSSGPTSFGNLYGTSRGRHRARARRRRRTSCSSSTCRARGRCGASGRSARVGVRAAAVVRGARSAAARPQQGLEDADPAAPRGGARRGARPSRSTTTWSSTTRSTRASSGCAPSSSPSAPGPTR